MPRTEAIMVPTPVHVLLIDISLVCSTHDIIKENSCRTRFSRFFSLSWRAPPTVRRASKLKAGCTFAH